MSANHLQRCRPFSVSMTNALRHVKMYTRQLDGKVSVSEQKECLLESIESYIRDQIEKAEEAICCSVQDKICDGDVILTYGWYAISNYAVGFRDHSMTFFSYAFQLLIDKAHPGGSDPSEENVPRDYRERTAPAGRECDAGRARPAGR